MGEGTEYLVENLKELIDQYDKIDEADIPSSLKFAALSEWELVLDIIGVEGLAYDHEQRKKDRTKLVRLDDVLKVLSAMEQATVRDNVVNPKHLLKNVTVGLKEEVQDFIAAIIDVIVNVWRERDWLRRCWPLVKHYWQRFFLGLAITELAALIRQGMKLRDNYAGSIRDKALFQNLNAPRYRRRKVTRK